jgi:hypothetical protein
MRLQILHNVLFIDKIRYAARSEVRSSVAPYAINRKWSDQSPETALEIHGARDEAMAARAMRETRVYVECARSPLMRSIAWELDCWFLG